MNNQSIGQHYLENALNTFRDYKKLGERAFAQLNDEDFFRTIDEESNSIAVIMKHLAGNMISRWTDFLTSDGEKAERNRDMEFVMLPETTKDEMIAYWEKGWKMHVRCNRATDRGRPVADCYNSRTGSHGDAGNHTAGGALCESCWPDCLSRETFKSRRVAIVERP